MKTDSRICVICPPGSKAAESAMKAGAILVGEDEIFDAVKAGRVEFDRCICHVDSLAKLSKAGLGRILGPKGLLPSAKTGTVVEDVANTVKDMIGGSDYRERVGVVRMPVGQLGFTPEEMQRNIKAFIDALKKDLGRLSDQIDKSIHEVVSVCISHLIFNLLTIRTLGIEFYQLARLLPEWQFRKSSITTSQGAIDLIAQAGIPKIQFNHFWLQVFCSVGRCAYKSPLCNGHSFTSRNTFNASFDSSMSR